ncbi:hypothetical protein X777_08706 [Ooceraea biroi]|uniref:Uncharacterized protein n=1 Tax=Ooceraea biroi TaxID=2015173 RepID=A0A026W8A4_OOCBI|nr:hypothetical protein X777_08706 [Ooceraea biroi]
MHKDKGLALHDFQRREKAPTHTQPRRRRSSPVSHPGHQYFPTCLTDSLPRALSLTLLVNRPHQGDEVKRDGVQKHR